MRNGIGSGKMDILRKKKGGESTGCYVVCFLLMLRETGLVVHIA
jgi:hypothetical protein